jgi:hypothetical protein
LSLSSASICIAGIAKHSHEDPARYRWKKSLTDSLNGLYRRDAQQSAAMMKNQRCNRWNFGLPARADRKMTSGRAAISHRLSISLQSAQSRNFRHSGILLGWNVNQRKLRAQ